MTEQYYLIREAVADDAESYNAFFRKVADEPHNGISWHPGEYDRSDEIIRQRLIDVQASDNQVTFVAVDDDNQVIGEISALGRAHKSLLHSVGIGISVDPRYRGQGIDAASDRLGTG